MILIGILIGCQNKSSDSKIQIPAKPDPCKPGIVVINVKGMTCTGCEETITENVTSLGGIISSEVSHIDGIARIEFDSTLTTIRDFTNAIEKSGYHVADCHSINPAGDVNN
jgi:copper chaperone CopZ